MLSHRRVGALGLSAVLAAASGEAHAASGLIKIRGTRLYVEDTGPRDAPALLYLHGGPGSGGYDFSLYQRARLSGALRLIVIDQRGVLRSDAIPEGAPFGFDDLIEDNEALRRELGIRRWAVLGHSFGGYIALAYALRYPDSITRVLFEDPCFDFGDTGRYMLTLFASVFMRLGQPDKARAALAVANAPASTPSGEIWQGFGKSIHQLGKTKDDLYVHGPDKQFFDALVLKSGLDQAAWQRGQHQQRLLYVEGKVFTSLTPRLAELKPPALLLKGLYDPVTSPDQVRAFLSLDPSGRMVVFPDSGHFAHVEDADMFARIVTGFVKTGTVPAADLSSGWAGIPAS